MRKSSLSEFLTAGLSIELDGEELVISGLSSLPDAEADRIVEQIKTKKAEVIAELKERNDMRHGYSYDSAHEFLQYCLAGFVNLYTNDRGDLDWTVYKRCDRGSLYFLFDIWCESRWILYSWVEQGKIDELIVARNQCRKIHIVSDPQHTTEPARQAAPRQTHLTFDCNSP